MVGIAQVCSLVIVVTVQRLSLHLFPCCFLLLYCGNEIFSHETNIEALLNNKSTGVSEQLNSS